MTLVALVSATVLWLLPAEIVLRHDSDYGPYGGSGPSFDLRISPSGRARLDSDLWICSDGKYEGEISTSDLNELLGMVEDLEATSSEPPVTWMCPHSPAFWVTRQAVVGREMFTTNSCVSRVSSSPLARLFAFAHLLAIRSNWTEFMPAPLRPVYVDPSTLDPLPVLRTKPWM